jgi:excisionase family DNA binding protein
MPHTAQATTPTPEAEASNPLISLAGYLETLETRLAALEGLSEPEPLMTLSDAAEYTRAATKTLRRAIRAGELPTVGCIGRSPRLCREDIDAWLAQHHPAASRHTSTRPRRRQTRTPTHPAVDTAWSQLG